jgi:hypothetical protein
MQKNQPQQNNIQADDRNPNLGQTVLDPHQRILAVALEPAKNASNSDMPEQLQFILVNDSRTLPNRQEIRQRIMVRLDGKRIRRRLGRGT